MKSQTKKPKTLFLWTSIERVKSISGNIFAFAMVLIILSIHIPKAPKDVTDIELLAQIASQWPKFTTYTLSFLSISNYWILHNGIFNCLACTDKALIQLNMLFLLTVTFLPYPTALHGEYGRHSAVALVYGLAIVINYTLLYVTARYALSKPKLLIPDLHLPVKNVLEFKLLLPLGLALTGTALAFFFVKLSFLFFLLVPLSGTIPLRWIVSRQNNQDMNHS